MKTNTYFLIVFRSFFLSMRNFFRQNVEKIKTYISCSVTILTVVPFMRKRGKNIVEWGRPQMTIWRMRIACWIPKATNAHTQVM